MKRHRVVQFDFDMRQNVFGIEIQPQWEPEVQDRWRAVKSGLIQGMQYQLGAAEFDEKLERFQSLGAKPASIIAFHNKFHEQARTAFVAGAYYPALTGACALGERILNHLILLLRDDYASTKSYKKVKDKKSFDKWDIAIDTLADWDVLLPNVAAKYRVLKTIRNQSIHFKPDVDTDDRSPAQQALGLLRDIISEQFSGFGTQPWFIPNIPGTAFIKKDWETKPFIKRVYLPNCIYVSPRHRLVSINGPAEDLDTDNNEDISDEEFARRYDAFCKSGNNPQPAT